MIKKRKDGLNGIKMTKSFGGTQRKNARHRKKGT
jgi:hypothetical protein